MQLLCQGLVLKKLGAWVSERGQYYVLLSAIQAIDEEKQITNKTRVIDLLNCFFSSELEGDLKHQSQGQECFDRQGNHKSNKYITNNVHWYTLIQFNTQR